MTHRIVLFFTALLDAIRHVRSGGQTTRTRARTRAAAPGPPCRSCGQPTKNSTDWHDHLHR